MPNRGKYLYTVGIGSNKKFLSVQIAGASLPETVVDGQCAATSFGHFYSDKLNTHDTGGVAY